MAIGLSSARAVAGPGAASQGAPRLGLRVRLRAVHGLTPRHILRQPLVLPVVIGEFTVEEEYLWEDFPTVGSGEHSTPAAGKNAAPLQSFDAETLTLSWSPKWLVAPNQDPRHVRRALMEIGRKRAVFDLLATNRPGADFAEFAGYARLARMARTLKPGEPDTRYFALSFKQFRPMNAPRRRHGPRLPTTHKLDANDTLRSLARHYYGDGSMWRLIANANGLRNWGSEDAIVKTKRFDVGDRIKIPDRPDRPGSTGSGGTEYPGAVIEGSPLG